MRILYAAALAALLLASPAAAQVSGVAAQTVSGSVSVANFPATQPVSGTVSVGNFPATQPVSGTVAISGTPSVSVGNFPATQAVSGSVSVANFPATQPVSGTVAISGTPSVSVGNFPATQPVSGTVGLGAGSALVGKVGIDQTTPGTSNAVAPSAAVGAATLAFGALAGSPLNITSTATEVAAVRTGAPGTGRTLLIIENESTVPMRCGGSGVTYAGGTGSAAGVLLPGSVGMPLNLATTQAVYCISASGTTGVVSVGESY